MRFERLYGLHKRMQRTGRKSNNGKYTGGIIMRDFLENVLDELNDVRCTVEMLVTELQSELDKLDDED